MNKGIPLNGASPMKLHIAASLLEPLEPHLSSPKGREISKKLAKILANLKSKI
jgi:hypothetical protein